MKNGKDHPLFKNKEYESLQDSIKDLQLIADLTEQLQKEPAQIWYGTLRSDIITYSSFDRSFKKYCVIDTARFVEWELEADTSTINGISCQKATGKYLGNNNNYTAWFARAIPISVAPLQFRGLPGLMVKVTNNINNVTISMIDLQWPAKGVFEITPCSGFPQMTRREMESLFARQQSLLLEEIFAMEKNKKN
jgi:GLPGLI family protein